jgi:uncharacterized protein YecA (UPF0149 family)
VAEDEDWMFDDEEDEAEWEAAWADVDQQAAAVLRTTCASELASPPPHAALLAAAASLREGIADRRSQHRYLVAACGWEAKPPKDDTEVWLGALAATLSPPNDPGTSAEDQAAVAALQHGDLLGMVAGLVRRGVGALFSPEAVQHDIETMPEIDDEREAPDDFDAFDMPVVVLAPLWQALGALDDDDRLTELGRWGLPRALLATWSKVETARERSRLGETDSTVALSILARRPMSLEDLRRELAKEAVFTDVEQLERSLIWRGEVFPFDDGAWGHLPALAEGVLLTHRLTAEETELGVLGLDLDLDLWGLVALDGHPIEGGGEVKTRFLSNGPVPHGFATGLVGPEGWLAGHEPGDLVGLRYVDGVLALETVTLPPSEETSAAISTVVGVARIAAEFDATEGDPDDPGASGAAVVLGARRLDQDIFRTPLPPLTEMLGAGGLEIERGYVGLPGTAWHGEPSWFNEEQRASYRNWQEALQKHRLSEALPEPQELVTLAESLTEVMLDLAAIDMSAEPEREPVAAAMAAVVSGPLAAVPLYLRARAAEGRGDVRAQLEQLEAAVAADPTSQGATGDLADLKAIAGDAREAHRLYALAGLDATAQEMQALRQFMDPPQGGTGRNKPCPCGSGRKYKLCHGRTDLHPLPDRASWLWFKLTQFAQRGVNREELLDWAELLSNAPREDRQTIALAMADPVTTDFALFDGGLLEDFLDAMGPLLPGDERALARSWQVSDRRLLEILEVRPMLGLRVRDLVNEEELELLDRRITTQVQPKDLLFARPLDDGQGGLRFRADPMGLPRMMRGRLLDMLLADAPAEAVAAFLAPSSDPPQIRTTEGEEMVMSTARYELAAPEAAWEHLASVLDPGNDGELVEHVDVPGRGSVMRGTLTRDESLVTVQTNAIERLRRLQAMVLDADPDARLVDESTRPIESLLGELGEGGLEGTPPADAGTPEIPPEALDEIIRQQEEQWLDGPVPALRGRKPRDAAKDLKGRGELVALLDDFEWADRQNPDALTMSVPRLRQALGITES